MTCQKTARARRGLAHPKVTGGRSNEPDPPYGLGGLAFTPGQSTLWPNGYIHLRRLALY
jgi:hypothetical protein